MTTCKECKAQISTTADACPHCGAKRKKTSGCAVIIVGFICLLALSSLMRACSGGSSTPSTPTNSAPASASEPAPSEPAKVEPAEVLAQSRRTVDEIEARFKETTANLKKYYGTADQVKQATDDLIKLAVVKGLYGDSKVNEEASLSRRANSLIPKLMQQQRTIYASATEEVFVKNGMDVKVTANGAAKEQLRVKYVLMSQPLVYKLQNEMKFSENAKTLGFKKIIYTDGYDETWTVDL